MRRPCLVFTRRGKIADVTSPDLARREQQQQQQQRRRRRDNRGSGGDSASNSSRLQMKQVMTTTTTGERARRNTQVGRQSDTRNSRELKRNDLPR
ncbi:hypothetical protein V1478_012629 [Vespula squamosa]|uniref:Uncharacterized protein n=1 Tax=Vespula squamosa TaxID=30214 RepID=A0ABD2A8I4_VESSQ